ncbi:hypothetical protein SLS60_002563 [Paraconiothyrium brasiliense]|uniref:Heterokaryon incompatibility domain-containing protein n=1 Tax=Paraconiothyrium brasiliense TaxID=300254 RepID=A0ABR3RT64_9PLEO
MSTSDVSQPKQSVHVCAACVTIRNAFSPARSLSKDYRSGWPVVRLELGDLKDLTINDSATIATARSKSRWGRVEMLEDIRAQSDRCVLDRALERLAELWMIQENKIPSAIVQEDPDVRFYQDMYLDESLGSGYTCQVYPVSNDLNQIVSWEKTRILLDMDYDVRLIETAEVILPVRDAYIALSHCWGRSQSFRLLRENIAAHKKGIELGSLPQTFKDAVALTRKLSVCYLWIDSLCIIQDDVDDWRKEAALMADVYSNAYLTISAARAGGDDEGFLQLRKTSYVTIHVVLPDQTKTEFFIGPEMPKEERLKGMQDPVDTRAWIFQEALLSQRLLRFHRDEMSFMCQSRGLLHNMWYSGLLKLESRSERELQEKLPIQEGIGQIISRLNNSEGKKSWQDMVKLYLDRRLTLDKDRLPALAGLAKRVAQDTKVNEHRAIGGMGEYLAGMWSAELGASQFCEALLWRPIRPIDSTTRSSFIPSWSYLHASGPIQVYPEEWEEPAGMMWPAQFKRAYMEPLGPDPYGELRSGYIVVHSMIVNLDNGRLDQPSQLQPSVLEAHFLLDSEDCPPKTAVGMFVQWVQGQEDEAENIWGSGGRGLLLQEVSGDDLPLWDIGSSEQIKEVDVALNTYRRIGLFQTLPMEFEDWKITLNAIENWVDIRII